MGDSSEAREMREAIEGKSTQRVEVTPYEAVEVAIRHGGAEPPAPNAETLALIGDRYPPKSLSVWPP